MASGAHDLDAALALISGGCVFESTEPGPDGTRSEVRAEIGKAWQPIFDDANTDLALLVGRRHVRGVDVLGVRGGLVTEKVREG
jgi:hypothetical protein